MQSKLLTNGNMFKRTDGRWGGVVWYADEQTTYDRCECTAQNQIYPILGDKVAGDITAADIKNLLNRYMNKGLSYSDGVRKHQQAAAYILMLNTGLRSGKALGLKNSDIDLDNKRLNIQNSVKEVYNRDGVKATGGKTTRVGKTKTKTSKRTVPLNNAAIDAIKELRKEYNYGEESPLICDEHGDYTKPVNFRKRFYRILKDAGIETK